MENKKNKARGRGLFISALVLLEIVQIVLTVSVFFIPLSTERAISYTCKKLFVDLDNIDVMTSLFKEENYRLEMSSALDDEGKIKEAKGFAVSDDGNMKTLKTIFNGNTGAVLTIKYDDINVYFGGFSEASSEYIGVPRDNIKEVMEKSIFHPQSGSFYALDSEEYDNFLSEVEKSVKEDESVDFNFNKIINEFSYKLKKKLDVKTTFGFSKNAIGICKKLECVLTEEKVDDIMEVFEQTYEKYDELSMFIDEEDLENFVNRYRRTSEDKTVTVAFYINNGRIVEITVKSIDSEDVETNTTVVFDYGNKSSGYTLKSKNERELVSKLQVREYVETYTKKEENGVITIYVDENTTINGYNNGNKISSNETNTYQKLVWNLSSNKYVYTVGLKDSDQKNTVKGDLCIDINNKNYVFTINEITTGEEVKTGDIITLKISKCLDNSTNKYYQLFEMTEDEFTKFYRTSKLYYLEEYYDYDCTKDDDSMYTLDKKPIFNDSKLRKKKREYSNIFNRSMNEFYSVYADRDTSLNYGYIHDEETKLYFLMSYTKRGVDIKYSYSLTPELESTYHATSWSEDGESIKLHDLVQLETVEPTCDSEGKTVFQCKICNDKVAIYVDKLKHKKVTVEKTVLCADNTERKASIEKCERCGLLYGVNIENYCGVTLTKLSTGGYKCSSANYTLINGSFIFDIPESLAKELNIVEVDCSMRYGVTLCQLPYGITTFKADMFNPSFDSLNMLIIPSTVKNVTKVGYLATIGLKRLEYIYYCGSEEDCNNMTGFADFLKKCPNAKVVYCPKGFSPEMIENNSK